MRKAVVVASIILLSICQSVFSQSIKVGAERMEVYFPFLQNKRVAIVANPTSMVGTTHLVDTLLAGGVEVRTIFCPEHGFRGEAEAGAAIANAVDRKTGLPIVSL